MPGSETVLEEMHTNVRAYILLRTVQGKSDQVVTALRGITQASADEDLMQRVARRDPEAFDAWSGRG